MNKFTALAGTGLLLLGSAGLAQEVTGPTDRSTLPPEASLPGDAAPEAELPTANSSTTSNDASLPAPDATTPDSTISAPDASAPAGPETALNEDAAPSAAFTDAEIKSFAAAALEIQNLPGDAATKQEQAATIVAQSGIDAETFNAIGQAMQSNPEVAQRVQLAAATIQGQPPEG